MCQPLQRTDRVEVRVDLVGLQVRCRGEVVEARPPVMLLRPVDECALRDLAIFRLDRLKEPLIAACRPEITVEGEDALPLCQLIRGGLYRRSLLRCRHRPAPLA